MENDKSKFHFVKSVSPLKQIRSALDLSREEFASRIGTTGSTVYRWETGRSEINFTVPQMKCFYSLLESLGLHINDLPDNLGPPSIVDDVD